MTTSTRRSRLVPRSGLALLLSLVAIIVIGAIISAISGAVMIETRTGEIGRRQNQAFDVADAAAGEIVGDWESGVNNSMLVGASRTLTGSSPFNTGTYTATITRTNSEIFLVDVTGRDRPTQARQRLGILVKLRVLTFEAEGALTTRGASRIGGSATITGVDNIPAGWGGGCPAAGAPLAGVRHPNPAQINFIGGCGGGSCIGGTPGVLADATVNDDTFFNYGESDWTGLSQNANVVLAGGTRSGAPSLSGLLCNRASGTNWGEPLRVGGVPACYNYFPTIFFNGDTRITGTRGQGIIMVNGDLNIAGNFVFNGIIIVRGKFEASGNPVITGGILAANVDFDNAMGLGNITINFSRCAIQAAQRNGALGAGFRSRGWTQIF